MNPQLEAAWKLHCFFNEHQIPYFIMGGIAVQFWGEPRFTRDLDITIVVEPGEEVEIINAILACFPPRIENAKEFAVKYRVILVTVPGLCDVDISLGFPGYEMEAAKRAIDYDIGNGRFVRLCSAEDLIIHKIVAHRPQDITDVEGVLIRQRNQLDFTYIQRWLKEFAEALDMPEIEETFEELCHKVGIDKAKRNT